MGVKRIIRFVMRELGSVERSEIGEGRGAWGPAPVGDVCRPMRVSDKPSVVCVAARGT